MTRTTWTSRIYADPRIGDLAGALLVLAALLLYFVTLDTGLLPRELEGGDLITHQYAQVQARPSNAPGYPLYTMGGWLWFHGLRSGLRLLGEPLPNPIPLLSSYSTLWALAALALLYQLLRRISFSTLWPAGNWPLAWLICAFYAVTYFFWYYATTTEQYSSAVAQTVAIVYVYLSWRARADAPDAPGALWRLVLLAFLCGLSLAHMLTVAFIVPPLVAVILWQAPWLLRSLRTLMLVTAAALLPLLSYGYVYMRGAAHPEWWGSGRWANAQEWFWSFVGTAQGREELGWGFEPGRAFLGNGFPELIWQELSIPILLIGLLGLFLLDRRLRVLLFGTLAIYLVFNWAYRYGNWFQVILPAYPLLLMGVMAVGDRWQQRIGVNGTPSRWRQIGGWAPHLLLILAIGWRLDASLPAADSRNRPEDMDLSRPAKLLGQPLPPGVKLFAALDDALSLQYLSQIWGVRPDVVVVSRREAADALRAQQAVLATWESAGRLADEMPSDLGFEVQGVGPDWVVLAPPGATWPAEPFTPMNHAIAHGITLVGVRTATGPDGAPAANSTETTLDVTLFWRLEDGWPDGMGISVRPTQQGAFLADPRTPGAIVQQDRSGPVHGLLRLGVGSPGRVVADGYRFTLAEPLPEGADGVVVIVYRSVDGGFENLAEIRLPLILDTSRR